MRVRREGSIGRDPPFPRSVGGSGGRAGVPASFLGKVPGAPLAGHAGADAVFRPARAGPGPTRERVQAPSVGAASRPPPPSPPGEPLAQRVSRAPRRGAESPQRGEGEKEGGSGRAATDGQPWNPGRAPTWPARLFARRIPAPPGARPLPLRAFFFFPLFPSSRPIRAEFLLF